MNTEYRLTDGAAIETIVRISSRTDLRNWVDDNADDSLEEEEYESIVSAIQAMDHPAWGRDWREFLGELPMLVELIQ